MTYALIDRLFLSHPRSASQSYLEHLRFAWRFGAVMAAGAAAAFVHGILPCVYQTAASDRVRALHTRLTSRESGKSASEGGNV